ncbi:hypothetical protein L209DRAFT_704532 [Thermothelomyces heterothallicus CBS 203.75]
MDHFNATIKGGKLIKTRRGLQVSRQRYNGLSFVNASPQENASDSGPPGATSVPASAQHEIRFVEDGSESQSEGGSQRDVEHPGSSAAGQLTKRRRRVTRRGKSPAASRAGASFRSSPAPFRERDSQVEDREAYGGKLQISLVTDSAAAGASGGTASDPESALSDHDRALLERYLDLNASIMYPYEDVLAHNPARESDFRAMVVGDRAALHCALMCGSIARAISTKTEPRDLAHHISKICAILNQKLSHPHAVDAVTLHCITTLACVGVCTVSSPGSRERGRNEWLTPRLPVLCWPTGPLAVAYAWTSEDSRPQRRAGRAASVVSCRNAQVRGGLFGLLVVVVVV